MTTRPCERATPDTYARDRASGWHQKGCLYISDAERRREKTKRRRAAARRVSKRANRR